MFEQLCKKFNIDMTAIKTEKRGECFQLGANKNYHIIRENDYYFLAIAEAKEDLNLSKMEMESIKSGESGMHLVAPEAVSARLLSPTRARPSSRTARSSSGRRATRTASAGTWRSCSTATCCTCRAKS